MELGKNTFVPIANVIYIALFVTFIGVLQGLGKYDICLIPMEKYSNCLCQCRFRAMWNTENRTLTRETAQKNLLC